MDANAKLEHEGRGYDLGVAGEPRLGLGLRVAALSTTIVNVHDGGDDAAACVDGADGCRFRGAFAREILKRVVRFSRREITALRQLNGCSFPVDGRIGDSYDAILSNAAGKHII